MPEALTESFCERCGTRYEFAAPTQLSTLRKTRGLISGLRNYIMSQDALSDAVGDAMRSEEETLAARQLEAFHESFNFCIQCRQYACTNCWNDPAGRCRTCVPIAGTDDLIERFEASFHAQHAGAPAAPGVTELGADDLNRRLGVDAWPSADLASEAGSNGDTEHERPLETLQLETSEVPPVAEPHEMTELPAEPSEPTPVADTEPITFEQPAEAAPSLAQEPPAPMLPALEGPVALRWEGDSTFDLEPEPVLYEPEPEPVYEAQPEPEPVYQAEPVYEAQPEPEPVYQAEPEPEPLYEPEPEPVYEAQPQPEPEPEPEPVYEAQPEPEPEPPTPRPIVPINETYLRIPSPRTAPQRQDERVAAEADDPALAARRAKLDLLGLGDPGEGPVSGGGDNVLPYRSSGASVHPAELAARGDGQLAAEAAGSFWDASAREVAGVMSHVGVQACGQCGLSLSASARFCRRCGTRQARSA